MEWNTKVEFRGGVGVQKQASRDQRTEEYGLVVGRFAMLGSSRCLLGGGWVGGGICDGGGALLAGKEGCGCVSFWIFVLGRRSFRSPAVADGR
jgi:hypothetical protein